MDKIIKEEIPKQARITVLYDRLMADEEYLSYSFQRYKQTLKEYETLQQDENIEIPKEILDEIEHHILPNYLIEEKKQKYMSMLTTISYVTAIFSNIHIFRYFIFLSLYPLICLIGLSMPKDKNKRKKYILNVFYNAVLIIFLLINVFLGLNLYNQYKYGHRNLGFNIAAILPISALIFILLLIPKFIKTFSNYINRRKNK